MAFKQPTEMCLKVDLQLADSYSFIFTVVYYLKISIQSKEVLMHVKEVLDS